MAINSAANLLSVDSLFTTQEERDEAQRETVRDIPLAEISDFPNHPFKTDHAIASISFAGNSSDDIPEIEIEQTDYELLSDEDVEALFL